MAGNLPTYRSAVNWGYPRCAQIVPGQHALRFAKERVIRFRPLVQTPACPLCFQAITASDRVAQDGDRPVHIHCLQRRAQAARDRATELVKTSEQLRAHADVLAREADVAIAEARRLVREGIAAGTLPRAGDAPPPFVGVTGDGRYALHAVRRFAVPR